MKEAYGVDDVWEADLDECPKWFKDIRDSLYSREHPEEDISEAEEETAVAPETFDSKEACEEVYGEDGCAIVDGSGVEGAELYQILIAPILGFEDAIDVCIFVMILGGFLAIMAKTKALETGIKILVKKNKRLKKQLLYS